MGHSTADPSADPQSSAQPPREAGPRRRGVLLVNVGTPDAPDVPSVRKYLSEFLADPLVIQLPKPMRWMQKSLARYIAWRRGPHSAEKYKLIWTDRGSPLRVIVEDQAAELAKQLPKDWQVFVGMRYGEPSISKALKQVARENIDDLVVVPLYPQFSRTTTGTTVDEVYRVLKKRALHVNVTARTTWHDDAGYLNAQAHLIAQFAEQHRVTPDETFLLFSAHGLPVSYIERGDPYERQLTQSVRLIVERLGWPADRQDLAYQSRMGPSKWLEPELLSTLAKLNQAGQRRVMLVPISFAADCLETLEELHYGAKQHFTSLGGELLVCPALNTHPQFIDALRQLIVRGPRPVVTWSRGHEPLIKPRESQQAQADAQIERLVMIGVSLANRVGSGAGPQLAYSQPDGLACVKKTHQQVEDFLAGVKAHPNVTEAFVWNTCFRFECYAWLKSPAGGDAHECVVEALRRELFPAGVTGVEVNTLFNRHAWHHLVRTIAGLNSGLPGDKDIIEQFQTAFQLSERVGSAGDHARALVDEAVRLARSVRQETAWGRLDPGYCNAALSRAQDQIPQRLANLRHVVIGGSTTSRSVLHTLYEQHNVKEPDVTLAYRQHQGGHVKLLRKAVGHGRRLRVNDYREPAVIAAVADADVVYFGIDRPDPVLTPDNLHGLRDFSQKPLYILDFNTHGSTAGLDEIPGVYVWTAAQLDAEVEAFAETMCASDAFPQIVKEAEAWIAERAPHVGPIGADLPCEARDEQGQPSCSRCGRATAPAAESSRSTA